MLANDEKCDRRRFLKGVTSLGLLSVVPAFVLTGCDANSSETSNTSKIDCDTAGQDSTIKLEPTNKYFVPPFKTPEELAKYTRLNNLKMPLLMAHRAGFFPFANLPECSLQSAEIAAKTGPLMIEFDIRTTSDGQLYCIHDATLERNTNGKGIVKETSSDVMKTLFMRNPKGDVTNIPVPTFEELLIWGENKALLWLDLKDAEPAKIVALIKKYNAQARVIVSAYGAANVEAYAKLAPELVYFVPANTKADLDLYISLGMNPNHMIGFSGYDFPKDILAYYTQLGIPTLCDIQTDGKLQPYQLSKKIYESVYKQGVPMLNTEWYAYTLAMFNIKGW